MTHTEAARAIGVPAFHLMPFVWDMQRKGKDGVRAQHVGKGRIRYHLNNVAIERLKEELRETGMKLMGKGGFDGSRG